jgi:DNA-binding MarR family transcriptional regulator
MTTSRQLPSVAYTKALDRLAALLRQRPHTARVLAEKLGCSRPTVYARIDALRVRGEQVYTLPAEADGTGPRPLAFGITS